MRRGLVTTLFVLMALSATAHPLTLVGETADTLSQGEWLIGSVRFPVRELDILGIEIHYGLTETIQLGTKPLLLLSGALNAAVNLSLSETLAIKTSALIPPDLEAIWFTAGGYLSLPGLVTTHLEGETAFSPEPSFKGNLTAELPLTPWLRFLAEVSFPLGIWGGGTLRFGEFAFVRLVVGGTLTGAGFVPTSYIELFAQFRL